MTGKNVALTAELQDQHVQNGAQVSMSRNKQMRSGFAMLEITIGIAIVGLIIAAAVIYGPKLMTGRKSDIGFASFKSLDNALEESRVNNGGAYPVGAGAIAGSLLTTLGGANATKDLTGWTYTCASGSNKTITIVTTSFESPEVQADLINKIAGRVQGYTAVASGTNALSITKTGVTCQ